MSKIEAILFVSGKPMSYKEIAEACQIDKQKISDLISDLQKKYQETDSGLGLILTAGKAQLFASSEQSQLAGDYLEQERQSDLTRPSLEALSIIAYRGPVSKDEIEKIRCVNCSLIIRNLLMRGLILESEKSGEKYYEVSHDFLRFIGLNKAEQLPDYEKLSASETVEEFLDSLGSEEQNEFQS